MPRALHEALSFTAIVVEDSALCKAVALKRIHELINLQPKTRCRGGVWRLRIIALLSKYVALLLSSGSFNVFNLATPVCFGSGEEGAGGDNSVHYLSA